MTPLPGLDEEGVGTPSTLTPDSDKSDKGDPSDKGFRAQAVEPARAAGRAAVKILLRNGGLLLLVLWCVTTWLYGSNYDAQNRIDHLNVSNLLSRRQLTSGPRPRSRRRRLRKGSAGRRQRRQRAT